MLISDPIQYKGCEWEVPNKYIKQTPVIQKINQLLDLHKIDGSLFNERPKNDSKKKKSAKVKYSDFVHKIKDVIPIVKSIKK